MSCEEHGEQRPAFACQHLAQSQPEDDSIGFHWSFDDGDLIANCDRCETHADAEGFLPEDYVLANVVLICRSCFLEIAAVNGVEKDVIERQEAAADTHFH